MPSLEAMARCVADRSAWAHAVQAAEFLGRLCTVKDFLMASRMKAGIHLKVTAKRYHADPAPKPSLSSSVARVLLERSPAHARLAHPRLSRKDPDEATTAMDLGSVAHKLLSGRGRSIVRIDAPDYRSKAAQEQRDQARAAGKLPILTKDYKRAKAMADAAREQLARIAGCEAAFVKGTGAGEVVLLWEDVAGPWCRSMTDWLHIDEASGSATIFDLKTTSNSAAPAAVAGRMYRDGFAFQGEFYRRGLLTLRPDLDPARVRVIFLVLETDPPNGLTAIEVDPAGRVLAEKQIYAALELWKLCLATDRWPAYPQAVVTAELPTWFENAWSARELADETLAALPVDPFHVPTSEQLDARAPKIMEPC